MHNSKFDPHVIDDRLGRYSENDAKITLALWAEFAELDRARSRRRWLIATGVTFVVIVAATLVAIWRLR